MKENKDMAWGKEYYMEEREKEKNVKETEIFGGNKWNPEKNRGK